MQTSRTDARRQTDRLLPTHHPCTTPRRIWRCQGSHHVTEAPSEPRLGFRQQHRSHSINSSLVGGAPRLCAVNPPADRRHGWSHEPIQGSRSTLELICAWAPLNTSLGLFLVDWGDTRRNWVSDQIRRATGVLWEGHGGLTAWVEDSAAGEAAACSAALLDQLSCWRSRLRVSP